MIKKYLSEPVFYVMPDADWESGEAWYMPESIVHRRKVQIAEMNGFRLVWLDILPEVYCPLKHRLFSSEEKVMHAYRLRQLGDLQTAYRNLQELE